MNYKICLKLLVIFVTISIAHTTQQRLNRDDDSNPFLDMASTFLQETLANQNGGAGGGSGGIAGIASIIGSFMQPEGTGKSEGGIGAAQIISGIGSLMANANGGNGFDPSIIGNVIEMFTANSDSGNDRQKRSTNDNQIDNGIGLDTILNVVSAFAGSTKSQGRNVVGGGGGGANEGIMSLLPMVMQAVNSFSGPEGEKTQAKHKEHAWVLPPFLEKIHVMWDHFSQSELAEALWKKSGIHSIFKVKCYTSLCGDDGCVLCLLAYI